MLNKLLLTAALVSTTYGADATLITGVDDHKSLHADQITIADSEHSSEKITAALNGIQSILTNPDAITEELKQAILELSELSYINRLNLRDCGGDSTDNFKLSATFELKIPEIQSLVRIHAATLLPILIRMLSDPIYSDSTNLFELFLLTAFSADLTPELFEIFMSDSTLSLIDSWLASGDSLKESTILFLLCQLINTVKDSAHIAKLQVLSLEHLNIFLQSKNSLLLSLIILASFDVDNTAQFIYKLHQKLIALLYYPFTTSIVYGSLTSSIEGIDLSSVEHYIAKKAAFMLTLLKNYRNDFLKLIIETLDFAPREVEETILAFPEISESRYVQIGNPKFCEQPTIPNDPKELNKRVLDFFQSRT